jgi:hypothetical protein
MTTQTTSAIQTTDTTPIATLPLGNLRSDLGDVGANWKSTIPLIHRAVGGCLKHYAGETKPESWVVEVFLANEKLARDGGERTVWFCERCVVTVARAKVPAARKAPAEKLETAIKAAAKDVKVTEVAEAPKVEVGYEVHGEPCPTCHVEMPISGVCPTCTDGHVAKVTEPALLDQIRRYASQEENYTKGWDVIVEAYTDVELLDALGKTTSFKGAIKKLRPIVDTKREQLDEIRNA